MSSHLKNICWFAEITGEDSNLVGTKGAQIGELIEASIPIPDGFIVTTNAYLQYSKKNNLNRKIQHLLATADYDRPESLIQVSGLIKKLIIQSEVPETLIKEIFTAYTRLGGMLQYVQVAIRPSLTENLLQSSSYPAQQDTVIYTSGEANLLLKIKELWASFFDAHMLHYRHLHTIKQHDFVPAIIIQKIPHAEKSGRMYTADPFTTESTKIYIESTLGLSDLLIKDLIVPDLYVVSKHDLLIIKKTIITQLIILQSKNNSTKESTLAESIGKKQKITDNEILELADLGKKLEKHLYFPQECEWAIEQGKITIVQTRQLTPKVHSHENQQLEQSDSLLNLAVGTPVSPGIATGIAKIVRKTDDSRHIHKGDIVIIHELLPEYIPLFKHAAGIIIEKSNKPSHKSSITRNHNIPIVENVENITKLVTTGLIITINGTKGTIHKGGILWVRD